MPKKLPQDEHNEEDIELVEEADSTTTGFQSKTRHVIKSELKKCQKERQEYLGGWQRAQADLVNAKRMADVSRKQFAQFATSDLITQLLPVLDSFDMALTSFEQLQADDLPDEVSAKARNWRKGVEYIYTQFVGILEHNGVTQLDPLGDSFDPHLHESIKTEKVDKEDKNNIIVAVVQKGYQLHERMIRPARVHVGEYEGN